jgi:hypothetical protein
MTARNCLKKGRAEVVRYSSRYEKEVSDQSIRCRMEMPRRASACLPQ